MSTAVLQGNVDREILDEAKRMRADLIVMSSHRTGVRTYFLGLQCRPRGALRRLLGAGGAPAGELATLAMTSAADREHAR